jgi:hypothetical protein
MQKVASGHAGFTRKATSTAATAAAEPSPIVPIDFTVAPHTRSIVITGPNTGGKTAALKALGLAVTLANAGLGVPAQAPAILPHFSSVLADIGDEQSLSASLSTFSGHLQRIQAARAESDGRCLVLLDEVGTGTDPLGVQPAQFSAYPSTSNVWHPFHVGKVFHALESAKHSGAQMQHVGVAGCKRTTPATGTGTRRRPPQAISPLTSL